MKYQPFFFIVIVLSTQPTGWLQGVWYALPCKKHRDIMAWNGGIKPWDDGFMPWYHRLMVPSVCSSYAVQAIAACCAGYHSMLLRPQRYGSAGVFIHMAKGHWGTQPNRQQTCDPYYIHVQLSYTSAIVLFNIYRHWSTIDFSLIFTLLCLRRNANSTKYFTDIHAKRSHFFAFGETRTEVGDQRGANCRECYANFHELGDAGGIDN